MAAPPVINVVAVEEDWNFTDRACEACLVPFEFGDLVRFVTIEADALDDDEGRGIPIHPACSERLVSLWTEKHGFAVNAGPLLDD